MSALPHWLVCLVEVSDQPSYRTHVLYHCHDLVYCLGALGQQTWLCYWCPTSQGLEANYCYWAPETHSQSIMTTNKTTTE